ncbi:MAG: FecR domain-containing protein [Myxococcota bacterium]
MSALASLLASLVVAASPDPFADLPPNTPVRTYVVQPGDSAWSIAAEFYGNGDKYPVIYKFNGYVGLPPFLLSPGQVLRLPVLGRGPEAQIEWLRRDVKAKPPRALDWRDAREKMNLWRLYRVSTGEASAAHIVFEDASDLRLREQALLVIYGASATAAATQRNDKHEVVLEQGTIQGGLAKLDADAAPLVVKTPSGQVDITGRLTQIQAEALASMVSAFEGGARVTAKGESVTVAEGQGTIVEKGKKPEKPRPLPAAPAWEDPSPALVVALPGDDAPAWEARWLPVDGAATYRVELAVNGDFKNVAYDAEVGAGVNRLRLEALGFGRWSVRVSTRDKSKLESKAGVPREILVVPATASRRVTPKGDGHVEAVGILELRPPDGIAVAVDGGPAAAPGAGVRLLAGQHHLTWTGGPGGAAKAESQVDIVAVSGDISVSPGLLPRGDGEPLRVRVEVKDERGQPALVPGLIIESTATGDLPTFMQGASGNADVPPVAADGPTRVRVRARWAGGVLAEKELDVTPPPPRRAASAFVWSDNATTPIGACAAWRGADADHADHRADARVGHGRPRSDRARPRAHAARRAGRAGRRPRLRGGLRLPADPGRQRRRPAERARRRMARRALARHPHARLRARTLPARGAAARARRERARHRARARPRGARLPRAHGLPRSAPGRRGARRQRRLRHRRLRRPGRLHLGPDVALVPRRPRRRRPVVAARPRRRPAARARAPRPGAGLRPRRRGPGRPRRPVGALRARRGALARADLAQAGARPGRGRRHPARARRLVHRRR